MSYNGFVKEDSMYNETALALWDVSVIRSDT